VKLPDFFAKGQPLCAETDPEAYFPPAGGNRVSKQAKKLCEGCGLLYLCRDWAMQQGTDLYGTWGGTTREERARPDGRA
jgi:hypothetical protein